MLKPQLSQTTMSTSRLSPSRHRGMKDMKPINQHAQHQVGQQVSQTASHHRRSAPEPVHELLVVDQGSGEQQWASGRRIRTTSCLWLLVGSVDLDDAVDLSYARETAVDFRPASMLLRTHVQQEPKNDHEGTTLVDLIVPSRLIGFDACHLLTQSSSISIFVSNDSNTSLLQTTKQQNGTRPT